MDILFTIIASTLMLVGFLVICRSSSEDEDDFEYVDEDGNVIQEAHREETPDEVKKN